MNPIYSTHETKAAAVERHFAELEKRGIVVPARDPRAPIVPGPPNPGGLARFLADRHR